MVSVLCLCTVCVCMYVRTHLPTEMNRVMFLGWGLPCVLRPCLQGEEAQPRAGIVCSLSNECRREPCLCVSYMASSVHEGDCSRTVLARNIKHLSSDMWKSQEQSSSSLVHHTTWTCTRGRAWRNISKELRMYHLVGTFFFLLHFNNSCLKGWLLKKKKLKKKLCS